MREGFVDFAKFTFELIGKTSENNNNLKFAAVNSQIALELFLKFYYVKTGKVQEILKRKHGLPINEFNDFSQILNHFYATRTWSYGQKNELAKLLDVRNAIVHKGQSSKWDADLAVIIVRTMFFINATAWVLLRESILVNNYNPHEIGRNPIWRAGAEDFAEDFCDKVYPCLSCGAYALTSAEVMVLDSSNSEEDFICLCCLSSLNGSHVRILPCYHCCDEAYYLDSLNEQPNQQYVGKCVECKADDFVRKCASCDDFYHPSSKSEVLLNSKYYCCQDCAE
ncbi:hypothetical protein VKY20_00505 [Pseudomonas atacamensis]|uniref:hypothetical protein n=1 Tax=Pseudomonas atacamensis TaxID=2565368 RepID=UPI002B47375E|nr:hypothetical protein [Pseudomonas atacamensis]MEB2854078.1 hypothetical protein [Pseudomonas atacamensis]